MKFPTLRPKDRGAIDFETYKWADGEPIFLYSFAIVSTTGLRIWRRVNGKSKQESARLATEALRLMQGSGIKEWWAHNGGRFDGLFFVDIAQDLGLEQELRMSGGRVIAYEFGMPGASKRDKVKLLDSKAIIPSALKYIPKDFGLTSVKVFEQTDYDAGIETLPDDVVMQGNLADCDVVLAAITDVEQMLAEHGGRLKSTLSSSALSTVRAHLKASKIAMPEVPPDINIDARNAYFGGRIEVFTHFPPETLTEWDVNSSYPYSMQQPLPWYPQGRLYDNAADRAYRQGAFGVVRATVEVPDMEFPILPVRIEKSVFFPTGALVGWWTAVELEYAEACGCVVRKVHEMIIFEEMQPFDDFISEFYEMKRTATGGKRAFAKLILNGAYGKFAERPEKEEVLIAANEDDAEALCWEGDYRPLHGHPLILMRKKFEWPKHTNYAAGAYITARSRILLHRALVAADRPSYVDTDAIHAVGAPRLDVGLELGQWKREFGGYKGEFFAPKIYRLTGGELAEPKIACKGFPVDPDEFESLISGTGARQGIVSQLKTMARGQDGAPYFSERLKQWSGRSMKRRITDREGRTRPWRIDELNAGLHLEQKSPHHN